MQPAPDDNAPSLLVLRVWRDPTFRARLTWGEVEDTTTQSLVKTDPAQVLDFVARWLEEV